MQSKFFNHQGASLHYQIGGKEAASVMVLLHGGFGSIADFEPLLPRLLQHYRVIAVDTRGHGRSTLGTAALTYAQAADDMRQILRSESVENSRAGGARGPGGGPGLAGPGNRERAPSRWQRP